VKILIDTREQNYIEFQDYEFVTLSVGDYTTKELRHKFVIERKSPQDLYGTLLKGHKRFRNELKRAEARGIELVVMIECSKDAFVKKIYPGSRYQLVPSTTLIKIIDTISVRYNIKFIWSKSRIHLKAQILKLLKEKLKDL